MRGFPGLDLARFSTVTQFLRALSWFPIRTGRGTEQNFLIPSKYLTLASSLRSLGHSISNQHGPGRYVLPWSSTFVQIAATIVEAAQAVHASWTFSKEALW